MFQRQKNEFNLYVIWTIEFIKLGLLELLRAIFFQIKQILTLDSTEMLISNVATFSDKVGLLNDIINSYFPSFRFNEIMQDGAFSSLKFLEKFISDPYRDVSFIELLEKFISDPSHIKSSRIGKFKPFSNHTLSALVGFSNLQKLEFLNVNEMVPILSKSLKEFTSLRLINNGEEIYQLVRILRIFCRPTNLISLLKISEATIYIQQSTDFYLTSKSLRTKAWIAIRQLTLVLEEVSIIRLTQSRSKRSSSLNHAFVKIYEVLDYLEILAESDSRTEKPTLKKIANLWLDILLKSVSEIGQVEIDKPIANPYTIGDPVFDSRFVGREDILRQLEELWFINTSPQSVILYGHRRMGKTSILRNATTKVNTEVRVAYVNLLSVSSASNGITDILMAICDALEEATEIPVPSNNDLLQFPETTFRRYLEQITKTFTGKGLIIALDEFEKIEELIDAGKLSKDFLGFLRGMVQMSSNLAFAFAGLHTLQEMNADYFQPFFSSFISISVTFLTREATHQVLANPDPEFLLEYEPAALDHIYDLTNGQPYLTQLIGFQLVRMFNDYVFEQGKPRDRTFTIDDVHTICSGENFFTTGINYFNGVWQQAAEGATHQQDILKALAPHPQGLTESELISQTNLPSETLQAALKTLKDHDVIRSQKTNEMVNWAIAVELFRTWVVKYKLM
jgi:hypothetical protein